MKRAGERCCRPAQAQRAGARGCPSGPSGARPAGTQARRPPPRTHRSRHCLPTRPGRCSAMADHFSALPPICSTSLMITASSCGGERGGRGGGGEGGVSARPRLEPHVCAGSSPRREAPRHLGARGGTHLGRPRPLGGLGVHRRLPPVLAVRGGAAHHVGDRVPVALAARALERTAQRLVLGVGPLHLRAARRGGRPRRRRWAGGAGLLMPPRGTTLAASGGLRGRAGEGGSRVVWSRQALHGRALRARQGRWCALLGAGCAPPRRSPRGDAVA